MEKVLETYLEKVEKYLKRVPVSERTDILKEIKSGICELQNSGKNPDEIIERLGKPGDLAKAYLADILSEEKGVSWNKFLLVCAFYSVAGLSGMFIIPCLGIIAPSFIFFGAAMPVLGFIKMVDNVFNFNIPYVENINVCFNGIENFNPVLGFAITALSGILLYLAGRGAWKLLLLYCRKTGSIKRKLQGADCGLQDR